MLNKLSINIYFFYTRTSTYLPTNAFLCPKYLLYYYGDVNGIIIINYRITSRTYIILSNQRPNIPGASRCRVLHDHHLRDLSEFAEVVPQALCNEKKKMNNI